MNGHRSKAQDPDATRERYEGDTQERSWDAFVHAVAVQVFQNMKRTYDEYQELAVESIKRNRSYVDKVLSDAQESDNRKRIIADQALQNAVETANMVGKQAMRHGDIAIDNQWNPVQQGAADTMTIAAIKGIVAEVLKEAEQ